VAKELERDLGLYATVTISIGAMIGSGIFVLPGKATGIAGPAAILAYLLAGVLVLPAALSKAEMATAMPEAGGTYLYIDRAMGPLPGTVAGIGAWFSLVFKSAFALVGLGAYLLVFIELGSGAKTVVALGLAVALLVVNVIGVKQSGSLQAAIVTLVLLSLIGFIAGGLVEVSQELYDPFFPRGSVGLLEATGFVYVSYAGVTKIASVAEEIEDPGRNIPLGLLSSVLLMMFVYTFVVFVIVGVSPPAELAKTLTPMSLAANSVFGRSGEIVLAVVAVFALTSMANAGILSSSRFPLAMSRDDLAPPALGEIHERFKTPLYSIGFTGAILLVLIAGVPVIELAKLASAFKIIVFVFVNVALVAFRESDLEWYDPEFIAPGYPWVQLFGIIGGTLLLTQMGPIAIGGAVGMIAFGVLWYQFYGRERTEREGAALDAIRRRTGDYSVALTEEQLSTGGGGGVLVAVGTDVSREQERTLLRVAEAIVKRRGGRIHLARFEAIPEQVTLSSATDIRSQADEAFESATSEFVQELDVPVEVEEIVAHDLEHAVANHLDTCGANLLLGEIETDRSHGTLLGHDVDWYMEHVDCDVVFVNDRGWHEIDDIVVIGDEGPYDPLKVLIADAIAFEHDASLHFLYAVEPTASDEQVDAIESYHEQVRDLCHVPTDREMITSSKRPAALKTAASGADLAVMGTSAHHLVYDVVYGALPDRLTRSLDCSVVLVHSTGRRRNTFIRYLLDRFVF
jgi:amino acid transporter/nucleotide-binding universal stress UspA family protein